MRRLTILDSAILLFAGLAFLLAFRDIPLHDPYYYDEADYVTAASKGLAANFLEHPSMSVVTFLQTGLDRGKQKQRGSLSDLVRGAKDITFYRHYHGPVYYYWLAVAGPRMHFDEYSLRTSGYAFHLLTFFTIYIGVLMLADSRIAALLASFLFLFGQSNIGTDAQITPHIAYVFFAVLTVLLFAGYLQTGRRGLWYAAVAAFAGAFCSIDYAILLPIAFAGIFVVFRDRIPDWRILLRSVGLFAGILLVVWPIGLLQLSAIKGYFYIAYLAMQRKGSYGNDGPLQVWLQRFAAAPVEYGIASIGLILVFFAWRKNKTILLPTLIYGFLMLLTTLKNTSLNPTYVSSILPCLAIVSGVTLAAALRLLPATVRNLATIALLATIFFGGYQLVMRLGSRPSVSQFGQIVSAVRDSEPGDARLLVSYELLPTLSYYFPRMDVHAYLPGDDANTILEKLSSYRSQGLICTGPLPPELTPKLNQAFHTREKTLPASSGATLFQFDGGS